MDYTPWYLEHFNTLNKLYLDFCKDTGETASSERFERFAEGMYRGTTHFQESNNKIINHDEILSRIFDRCASKDGDWIEQARKFYRMAAQAGYDKTTILTFLGDGYKYIAFEE